MENKSENRVFIATSLDGYIADRNGGIEWLQLIPNPDGIDMGYTDFMKEIDAIVMGRRTFETVCGFDLDWSYTVPVFVLSNTLEEIPSGYERKAQLVKGTVEEILHKIHKQGYHHLYIDGGITIQHFLSEDQIDELIVTIMPILLGEGITLFSTIPEELEFELVESKVYLDQVVQNHYRRKRAV